MDDKKYWRDRHRLFSGSMKAYGQKRWNEKANCYRYRRLREAWDDTLRKLDVRLSESSILDAGAGGGYFSFLYAEKGAEVCAMDISRSAVDKIAALDPRIQPLAADLAHMPFRAPTFDIVHCFDVLYHILDDRDWQATVEGLARASRRFILLHGQFSNLHHLRHFIPALVSPHIKLRPYWRLRGLLAKAGFEEVLSAATYVLSNRLFTYKFFNLAPGRMYAIDQAVLNRWPECRWATHHIKVFRRASHTAKSEERRER